MGQGDDGREGSLITPSHERLPVARRFLRRSCGTGEALNRAHQESLNLYWRGWPVPAPNGSADMLGWLVYEHGIEPHVSVFDRSARKEGTLSPEDFTYDDQGDVYFCSAGKMLTYKGTLVNDGAALLYRARKISPPQTHSALLKPTSAVPTGSEKMMMVWSG